MVFFIDPYSIDLYLVYCSLDSSGIVWISAKMREYGSAYSHGEWRNQGTNAVAVPYASGGDSFA
jgi:hypothetical protein